MSNSRTFAVAVIGGGLAGLGLSIQMARAGYSVILFEKHEYPFHRVCGEYISMESFDFLNKLGANLSQLGASRIKRLEVTTSKGISLKQSMSPGGMGISRFKLDHTLAEIARKEGVILMESTAVHEIRFEGEKFIIQTSAGEFASRTAAGCFGKRSRLDLQWKRPFVQAAADKKRNFLGVKYHIRGRIPQDTIYLHHFPGGYCGLSKVEDDRYCLCYLVTADQLARFGNSINDLEEKQLGINPTLCSVFENADRIFHEPVVISQISFAKKTQVEDHVLMVGDAAGMITPLCGNGMSMALHAAKIAADLMKSFLEKKINRVTMEKEYVQQWKKEFSRRLWVGRNVQDIFRHSHLLTGLVRAGRMFPGITRSIVRQTHGHNF